MNDKPKSLSNAEVDAKINAEAHELADKIGAVFDEVQPNLLVALLAVLGVAGSVLRRMDHDGRDDDLLSYAQDVLAGQLAKQRADDAKTTLQ